jgi:hypothetical protein
MTNFTDEMDKLAAQIAKSLYGDIALGDKIDGFKALTPYYVWQMKNRGKDDADDGLPDFDKFAEAIHGTETGNGSDEPGVSGRSRRHGN